jgi:hypothetical protein
MNLKRKLLHCNVNIIFNKQCLRQNIIPNYAKVNMKTNNHTAVLAKQKAEILRVKLEVKSLYKKKQRLNSLTYHKHIEVANMWSNIWPIIEEK